MGSAMQGLACYLEPRESWSRVVLDGRLLASWQAPAPGLLTETTTACAADRSA